MVQAALALVTVTVTVISLCTARKNKIASTTLEQMMNKRKCFKVSLKTVKVLHK